MPAHSRRFLVIALVAALLLLPAASPVAAAVHPGSDPAEMTVVGTRVFFAATTAAHGRELWVTDGTTAGTHEVADINSSPGAGSDPWQLTAMGQKVYFMADDGTGGSLWKSDGTAAGTKRLGGKSGQGLTNVGGRLLWLTAGKLWTSTGTVAGTRAIATLGGIDDWGPVAGLVGSYYFFTRTYLDEPEWRYEYTLWKTDGTPAGTAVVAPIGELGDYQPVEMASAGGLIYFLMNEPWVPCGGPVHLWRSNGTAAGTSRIYDFVSDEGEGVSYGLTSLGNKLYFGAEDAGGNGLWKTNGTESGTRLVKRIGQNSFATWCNSAAGVMTAAGPRLFFFTDGYEGPTLWRSRGTKRTTVKVYPIGLPGCEIYSDEPYCHLDKTPVAVGSRLFFPAAGGAQGTELWVSDGTSAGTHLVKDIAPGSSRPSDLASDGTRLFFSARDAHHGRELWVSDGTRAGTHMVLDINPG